MQTSQSKTSKKELFTNALGKVIKRLRDKSKLSSREIAFSMSLSKTTILHAEKGILDPQLSTFFKIAEAFNLTPVDLLTMVNKELPQNFTFED